MALIENLDACAIDVSVLHEPQIKTDWSTRKLFSDELVLVSTTPRQLVRWDSRYVYIDWGDGYREQHFRAYPVDDTPLSRLATPELRSITCLMWEIGRASCRERVGQYV